MILEQLFPGLNNELLQNGAASSLGKDIRFYYPFGELHVPQPVNEAASSRPFLEWHIRSRVLKHERIQLLTGAIVNDLLIDEAGNSVRGVAATYRHETVHIDAYMVVVVATGFHSHLDEWLNRHGYTIPEPEMLTTLLGYSTPSPLHSPPPGTWYTSKIRGGRKYPPAWCLSWKTIYSK